MKSFARTFFESFGAELQLGEEEWIVDLPPDLADAFGKPRLYLVFPQEEARELSPDEDLLVYGSRTFEQMLALLAERGQAACLGWPKRIPLNEGDEPPTSPLPLTNSRVVSGQVRSGYEPFYIFNFRVAYMSDEKQAVCLTVALDAQGRTASEVVDRLAEVEPLPPAEVPPALLKAETWPQKLEQAEAAARLQIEERAAQLEQEIRPRLEKALLRLTGYYRRLLAEVDTGEAAQDEAIRADLRQDLSRKINDELERHQLRVTLTPLSYALVLAPLAHYRLDLATPHTRQTISLKQNLYTGQMIEPPLCEHCREPLEHVALCERQPHLVHAHCLDRCHYCQQDVCLACGIQPCAVCAQPVCGDCVGACAYCPNWLCADHLTSCAICGAVHCPDHVAHCRWCGQSYCQQCVVDRTCETCRQALAGSRAGPPPLQMVLPLAEGAGGGPKMITEAELGRYRWSYAENRTFTVYVGRPTGVLSPVRSWLIVVVDPDRRVRHRHTVSPWQRFLS